MQKIAQFEKVSFSQFEADWKKNFPETADVKAVYGSIKMPERVPTMPILTGFPTTTERESP